MNQNLLNTKMYSLTCTSSMCMDIGMQKGNVYI